MEGSSRGGEKGQLLQIGRHEQSADEGADIPRLLQIGKVDGASDSQVKPASLEIGRSQNIQMERSTATVLPESPPVVSERQEEVPVPVLSQDEIDALIARRPTEQREAAEYEAKRERSKQVETAIEDLWKRFREATRSSNIQKDVAQNIYQEARKLFVDNKKVLQDGGGFDNMSWRMEKFDEIWFGL